MYYSKDDFFAALIIVAVMVVMAITLPSDEIHMKKIRDNIPQETQMSIEHREKLLTKLSNDSLRRDSLLRKWTHNHKLISQGKLPNIKLTDSISVPVYNLHIANKGFLSFGFLENRKTEDSKIISVAAFGGVIVFKQRLAEYDRRKWIRVPADR